MRRTRLAVVWCVVWLAAGLAVSARNLDGTLALIRRPVSTIPAVVKAGDTFAVTVASKEPVTRLDLSLQKAGQEVEVFALADGQPALAPQEGLVTVAAKVPADTAPGFYDLMGYSLPGPQRDSAERAVLVVAGFRQPYRFAHVTDVHIGKVRAVLPDQVLRQTAAEINRLGVDFVLVTGDLTESATPEQYRTFLQLLDLFEMPTFVSPGNHDRGGPEGKFGSPSAYDDYCGMGNYAFDWGTHRYLGLDTRWAEEYLEYAPYRQWLEGQLARPDPAFGAVFSHRIADVDYPYYQERLPAHNYRLYAYGHTHDDRMDWLGPKRLLLLNTSHEFAGTYNVVTVSGDQVVSIDHHHRVLQ